MSNKKRSVKKEDDELEDMYCFGGTASCIAKQVGENQYKTICCSVDGYLEYNGIMLIDYYDTPERVDALLELGNLWSLNKELPDGKISEKQWPGGVTRPYHCFCDCAKAEAQIKSLEQLNGLDRVEFVYIFTEDNRWKYFEGGMAENGLCDLFDELKSSYEDYSGKYLRCNAEHLSQKVLAVLEKELPTASEPEEPTMSM